MQFDKNDSSVAPNTTEIEASDCLAIQKVVSEADICKGCRLVYHFIWSAFDKCDVY